jgi:hypothetical protein
MRLDVFLTRGFKIDSSGLARQGNDAARGRVFTVHYACQGVRDDTRSSSLIWQPHIVRILKEKLPCLMAQWVPRTSQGWYRASIRGFDAVLRLT